MNPVGYEEYVDRRIRVLWVRSQNELHLNREARST